MTERGPHNPDQPDNVRHLPLYGGEQPPLLPPGEEPIPLPPGPTPEPLPAGANPDRLTGRDPDRVTGNNPDHPAGNSPDGPDNPDDPDDDNHDPIQPDTLEPAEVYRLEHDRLLEEFQSARNRYAFLAAGRASRTFHFGTNRKFSRNEVAKAKEQYRNSRAALIGYEVMMAYDEGEASEISDLQVVGADIAAKHDQSLAEALVEEIRANSIDYEYKRDDRNRPQYEGDEKIIKVVPVWERRHSVKRRIHEWWGKQSDGSRKGKINKAAVTGVFGVAAAGVAAVTAPILGGVLGAAGAAALVGGAARISRSRLVFQLDRHVNRRLYLERMVEDLETRIKDNADAVNDGDTITRLRGNDRLAYIDEAGINPVADLVEHQSSHEARDNHKRAAIAAAVVIGGTIVGELVHLIPGGGHAAKPAPGHHPGAKSGSAHHPTKPAKPAKPAPPAKTSTQPAAPAKPPHAKAPKTPKALKRPGEIYVNAKNVSHAYVSQVYTHVLGLHRGFTEMLRSANGAINQGDLVKVQPDAGNPNLFWYKVTRKGAKLFAPGAAESTKSVDVMKVLSHFGRVAITRK